MSFELTPDQRIFMDLYANQYNLVCEQNCRMQEQIQRNTTILNELRYNIQTIYSDISNRLTRNESRRQQRQQQPQQPISSSYPSFATFTSSFAQPILNTIMLCETTTRTFSDIEHPLNTECPISLEPFDPDSEVVQINRCGHIFNRNELSYWFQTNTRCPTCRSEITYTT